MTKPLLNISEIITEDRLKILSEMNQIAELHNFDFFVIGATARDIILNDCYGINLQRRMTYDVDLGINVSDWSDFALIKEEFLKMGIFSASNTEQRLFLENNYPLDLIPFGEIATNDSIVWPGNNHRFSLLGFNDVFANSLLIRIQESPVVDVKVISLAGLVILKLISWDEKYPDRNTDAIDIRIVTENYLEAGDPNRIYDEAPDIFDYENFDYINACARLLGRDIAKIAQKNTITKVLEILERETKSVDSLNLILDMVKRNYDLFEQTSVKMLIDNLKIGIYDILTKA